MMKISGGEVEEKLSKQLTPVLLTIWKMVDENKITQTRE